MAIQVDLGRQKEVLVLDTFDGYHTCLAKCLHHTCLKLFHTKHTSPNSRDIYRNLDKSCKVLRIFPQDNESNLTVASDYLKHTVLADRTLVSAY